MSNEPRHSFSLAGFSFVVLFFVAIFLATITARNLMMSAVGTWRMFGFHSPSNEFYLYRYLLFAVLPLGFNLMFGFYFALRFYGCAHSGENHARAWGLLALFIGWLFVFNLPVLLSYTGTGRLHWPPLSLYLPVYTELILFMPMGNLGALLGFSLGGVLAHFRRMGGK